MNPRIQVSETSFNLPPLRSGEIEEIEVETFSRLMREHFGIFSEPVPGKSYAVRYTGAPYDHSNEDCRSLQVFPHAKGTRLSPLYVHSILAKFDISDRAYLEAIAAQGKLFKMMPHASKGPIDESGENAV